MKLGILIFELGVVLGYACDFELLSFELLPVGIRNFDF